MAGQNKRNTRQRMINLMYLVFIAMLAINYPEEVLDGFDLINEKLQNSLENSQKRNSQIYTELDNTYKISPDKTTDAYNESRLVKSKSDSLINYIQSLKHDIVIKTDGEKGNVDNIIGRDNLDASYFIMLGKDGEGKKLKSAIENYKRDVVSLLQDSNKQELIRLSLSTNVTKKGKLDNKNWEQSSFESMPTIASITYLTELQSNIRQAEGEVLNTIIKEIDIKDIRVNEVNAFVVPQSNVVMKGTNYTADIYMAARDTTDTPTIVVNGKELPKSSNGRFVSSASTVGTHKFKGFISMMSRDGVEIKKYFEKEYTVIEPMVTIEPMMMDVLYANYENPLRISVPGIVSERITPSASGGRLDKSGDRWIAVPSKVGQDMIITVKVKDEGGKISTLPPKKFRVRQLPDPTAFIEYTDGEGNLKIHKRGAIPRASLLAAPGIKAAIDDGILNVPFTVLGFRTFSVDAMGNAVPEVVQGANFSDRQLEQMRRMPRGTTIFIASITVIGPDKVQREISPMQIRLN